MSASAPDPSVTNKAIQIYSASESIQPLGLFSYLTVLLKPNIKAGVQCENAETFYTITQNCEIAGCSSFTKSLAAVVYVSKCMRSLLFSQRCDKKDQVSPSFNSQLVNRAS